MTERERRRHELLQRLEELLGSEHAATLMEHLPPDRWNELATKADLERFATKADLDRFATKVFATKEDLERFATKEDLERFATKADLERFASKSDLVATRDELRKEMEHLGALLTERIDAQGYRLEALLRERIDAQTKLLFFSILAAVMTAAGLGFGAAVL
jgi:hypothetical protein